MTWRPRLRIRYWWAPLLTARITSYVQTRDYAVLAALVGVPLVLLLGAAMSGFPAALPVVAILWVYLRDAVAWFAATAEERIAFGQEVLVRQFDVGLVQTFTTALTWEAILNMIGIGAVFVGVLILELPPAVMVPTTILGLPILTLLADRLDGPAWQ